MTVNGDHKHSFATIEESIEAFKNGEFIVVLDSTDRENEGDLIIAAEDMTTEKMAFMIRYTSGYVCAPMPPELTEKFDLPQMVENSTDPKRTAYTISVDAEHPDTTTGISAHDRALTTRHLASPKSTPGSFRRPGHILPLQARPRGVMERQGHTEATVDFCRLAGKQPVGVIGELVDDGEETTARAERSGSGMLRRDGCIAFGQRWGVKVCNIEDLVQYIETHT